LTSLRELAEQPGGIGTAETVSFGGLTIAFDERALRPRAWTAMQSEWAAELLRSAPAGPVLEICAGVGHIGLLAIIERSRDLVQVDLDEVACEFARQNAAAAGLASRVEVRHGRMEEAVTDAERFAVIVADPPWVPSADTKAFPEDPLTAIDGGGDGLVVARTCLEVIGRHLDEAGSALLQLGTEAQVAAVDDHLHERPGLQLRVQDFRTHEAGNIVVHLVRPVPVHA
jgi:release factor glutamine methyltransferase